MQQPGKDLGWGLKGRKKGGHGAVTVGGGEGGSVPAENSLSVGF